MTDQHHAHLFSLCLAGDWVTPATLWTSWSLAPAVVLPLLLTLVAGLRRTASSAAAGSGPRRWFLAGWLLLAVALVSPLCRLSATLMSAHMVQLMLLAGAGPACLALAWPGDRRHGRNFGAQGGGAGLGVLTAAYGVTVWVWHAPPVYAAVVTEAIWHWAGIALLVLVSVAFWRRLLARRTERPGEAMAAVLVTMLHTGLLGALLTFAPRVLYPVLAPGSAGWSLSPLEDQQLAGLVMWVLGGAFYLLVATALVAAWLRGVATVRTSGAGAGGAIP